MSWIRKYPTTWAVPKGPVPVPVPKTPLPIQQQPIQTTTQPQTTQPQTQVQTTQQQLQPVQDYSKIVNFIGTLSPEQQGTVKDSTGTILIFDYFIRKNTLYLIATFTSQGLPKINLVIDGVIPTEIAYDQGEPIRYFFMPVGNKREFSCRLNGRTQTIRPEIVDCQNRIHKLAIATLFKFEGKEDIQRFLEYYRKQGVDMFYFYFNGPSLPEDFPKGSDIFYKLWNFPYWNTTRYTHNAQMTFMASYRLRYFEANEWNLMIDLDEYVLSHIRDQPLVEYLMKSNWHLVKIRSHWAKLSEDGTTVIYNQESEKGREKYAYKHYFKPMFGIHSPKPYRSEEYLEGGDTNTLFLVHITNMKNMYTTELSTNLDREKWVTTDADSRVLFTSMQTPPPLPPSQTQVLPIKTEEISTNILDSVEPLSHTVPEKN